MAQRKTGARKKTTVRRKPAGAHTSGRKKTVARKKPAPRTSRTSPARARARGGRVVLLIATRKGAWMLRSNAARTEWKLSAPLFLGHIVHHFVQDPRAPRTLMLAARTGHLGPTVFRSEDFGKTWREARRPPAFPKTSTGRAGCVVDHVFWLTPGHAAEPGVWYAGTSPEGLFRSADGGDSWDSVTGFNDHPRAAEMFESDGTPDGPKLHSILIDPRDPRHMYLGMSGGGVHETTDGGRTWDALVDGMEVVHPFPVDDLRSHDPHCVRMHPLNPDRLYQQNHCGIYRLDRPATRWERIGRAMPKSVGDVGFPMVLHPRDPDTCWVFPMDGTDVWPRTSPGGKPAVYATTTGGKKWTRLATGLPKANAWFSVKRQAMTADGHDPVGIYFGATHGEVWGSRNEGARWRRLAQHLPHIYAVETARAA